MDLAGTHAFVTGASGFTGGNLCAALVRRGARVTALVRKTSDVHALERLGVRLVAGDLRDRASFEEGLAGCDTAYHVAAAFREAKIPDAEYTAINVGGTRNVIEAAEEEREYRLSEIHGTNLSELDETQLMRIELPDMQAALRQVLGMTASS